MWTRTRASYPSAHAHLGRVHDVSVHNLGVDGHQRPQVDVDTVRVQTYHVQDIKEELGPQSEVLHDEGEGEHLGRLVPDEGLLRLSIHQLESEENMIRRNVSGLTEPR